MLPKVLSYSLRYPPELFDWATNRLFPPGAFEHPIDLESNTGSDPSYYKTRFLTIQNLISHQFIKMTNSSAKIPEINVKRLPYPPHTKDDFLNNLQLTASLFFLICFNYTFMNTIRFVSTEKEKQLKESMNIMGLPMWIHWLSWFVRTIIMLSLSMIGITLLLKVNLFN